MRNTYFICFISLLTIIISACGEYPCAKTALRYSLIGFTDAETDTIILRRFTKNTSSLKDTFFFDEGNPLRFSRSNDTLRMAAISSTALLESSYDYQLFFPEGRKLFAITEIQEEQLYQKNTTIFNTKKAGCINKITSARLNGQLINFTGYTEPVYLRR